MASDHGSGRRQIPKTYRRYLTCSFLAGGGNAEQVINLDDLVDAVEMLISAGRVPPPSKWVEAAIAEAEVEAVEGLF